MIRHHPLGGGGGGLADPRPILSATPTRNPGGIIASATVLGPGELEITTLAGATPSNDPFDMGIFEFDLYDILGRTLNDSDGVDLGDMLAMFVCTDSAVGVEDVHLMCGLLAATMDDTDIGVAAGIRSLAADAGQWRACHRSATGGAWSPETAASATSGLAVGAQLQTDHVGTAGTQTRTSAVPIDASKNVLTGANLGTTPASINSQADWKRGFVGISAGAVSRVVKVKVSFAIVRPREVPYIGPFDLPVPESAPATYSKIRFIGHSMIQGTVTSPTWSGAAVPAGWDFYEDLVATDPFPAGVAPGVGLVPYVMLEADAFARPATGTKWGERSAANGTAMGASGFDVRLEEMFATYPTLGTADLVLDWAGANDGQDATELAIYRGPHGLERMVQLIRYQEPNAVIVLLGERTTDAVSYPHIADGTINEHKQLIASRYPFVYYVDADGLDLADAIHPSDAGYQDMAGRIFEVIP